MAGNSSIEVTNDGTSVATFNLNVNGNSLLLNTSDIVEAIQAMPVYQTEGAAYATWIWMMENTYHWDPYSGDNWQHAPYLYLNSIGFGYCDDVAQIYASILTEMGFDARVWWIEGHVVSEVFDNGSWKIFDVDLRTVYLDDQMNPQGYDFIVNSGADFAGNFAGSLYSTVTPESWSFGSEVMGMYQTTGNNFNTPPPQTPDFGGSAALILPGGASITIEDASAGFVDSIYDTAVPSLSLLTVSFGDLDGFTFEYPLIPVAITGSGSVIIDGTSYAIGSAALDARLADRSRPVYAITVDSDGGTNEIVYLLNSKRFSLSSGTSATIEGGNGNLGLVLRGGDGADTLRDAQILLGGDGNDFLSAAPGTPDRMADGVMDGGNGDDLIEIRASTKGVGIWGNSAFQLLGGAGDDRFVLAGTQIYAGNQNAALLDGGAGFDTLVWNGSYNLTEGGAQNTAAGLFANEFTQGIRVSNVEKIDLISARVTGLNLSFSAADVAAITAGSDFAQVSLGLGLTGTGNVLLIDAGDNQVDLTGWTVVGRSTVGGIEYDISQNGSSYIGIAVVSDRVLDGTGSAETLAGFAGADVITGGGGADILTGFSGNDTITQVAATTNAAAGTKIDGGDGDDTLLFEGNQAYTPDYVTIGGGDGDDIIRAGTGAGQYAGSIQIDGGAGNDRITVGQIRGSYGGKGHIDGGDGNDLIEVLDTGSGVGIWADSVFKLNGGAGDDRFILAGTQVSTHPAYTPEVNGGADFDTLVWNGSYNLTAAKQGQNAAVGLYAGQYAQQVQARNVEKIDLASSGVSGLTLRFTAGDVASITAGSDFLRSQLGLGLSGFGKLLFVDAGDNLVDVTGWALLGEVQFGGTNYQLLQSGASYLALDTVANHIIAERTGTAGSEALDTASASLSLADGDLVSTLVSSVWSSGSSIPAETAAALAGALALARSGGSVTASLAIADRLVDFLSAGETLVVTYNVTSTEPGGAITSKTVTFTFVGSNDAPILAPGVPDLDESANRRPGALAGATITALYAAGSDVNLLEGLPSLATLTNYTASGYNFVGGRGWFAANGIDIAALAGGTIVFADGTTGKIDRASNGAIHSTESAYIYYRAYAPGEAALSERFGITGSDELNTASLSLTLTDHDLDDTHTLGSSFVSAVWSDGTTVPAETLAALASALSLVQTGGSIDADFGLEDRFVDFLGAGETLTITYNVTVTDRAGASASTPATFTFTGGNNTPVLTADMPDLGVGTNVKPGGAPSGATVVALYAPGSSVNLLEGKPPLTTISGYYAVQQPGYTGAFNFLGGQNWFTANGIDIAALTGGTVVFSDGTTGKINQASDGEITLNEPAYIYYQSFEAGSAWLKERAGTNGSAALDTASVSLSFTDGDVHGSHTIGSSLASSVWSSGLAIPAETAAALANALALSRNGRSITASFALADRLVDFLGAGETLTITYDVTVTDQGGASASKPVTFTFTGSNDAPALTTAVPDLNVAANLRPGVAAGMTVAGLYAPGSSVNLLAGLPPLTTTTDYAASGYNFVGGRDWFAANGISIAALAGGTIVFADGTTGKIGRASNGAVNTSESAYIYYQAYTPGQGALGERPDTAGSNELDTASFSLAFTDGDIGDAHSIDSSFASSVWSGGPSVPAETAAALATALSLVRSGNAITANFAIADRLVDFLGEGETLTITYNVAVTDSAGGSASKPIIFTVTGRNDAPVLSADMPDLSVSTNVKPGAAAGATITALYAPGSSVNLLDGLPSLVTLTGYNPTSGYNFVGGRDWFASNGISIAALAGGTIVFADGTTGLIGRASNGAVGNPAEAAYIYYQAYEPGAAWLKERSNTTGSPELDTASVSLSFADRDLGGSHTLDSSLASMVWSGGSAIPAETAAALASALTLARSGGSISANFALADRFVDFLGAGETLAITYNVSVTDQSGARSSRPVTFTFTGASDGTSSSAIVVPQSEKAVPASMAVAAEKTAPASPGTSLAPDAGIAARDSSDGNAGTTQDMLALVSIDQLYTAMVHDMASFGVAPGVGDVALSRPDPVKPTDFFA